MKSSLNRPLINFSLQQVMKEAENQYPLAKIELIFRSVLFSNLSENPPVSKEKALEIIDHLLQENFYHNFANFALGIDAQQKEEYSKAKEYFLKAIHSKGPLPSKVNGDAAYELARLFLEEQKCIEAIAWFCKALLLGSIQASFDFLEGNFFSRSKILHSIMSSDNSDIICFNLAFILAMLSDKKFASENVFKTCSWIFRWSSQSRNVFINAFGSENSLTTLNTPKNPLQFIVNTTIIYNPYVFYKTLTYCYKQQIINEEIYLNLIANFFIIKAPEINIKDKAIYHLFEIFLAKKDWKNAGNFLDKLNPIFSKYKEEDLRFLSDNHQDELIYKIFRNLCLGNHYDQAMDYINKIKNFSFIDKELSNFLRNYDPEGTNHEWFLYKKNLITKIYLFSQHSKFQIEGIDNWIKALYLDCTSLPTQIRHIVRACVKLLETFSEERKSYKQAHPLRFFPGDFFFKKEDKIAEFINACEMLNHSNIMQDMSLVFAEENKAEINDAYSRHEYADLLNELANLLKLGRKNFARGYFNQKLCKQIELAQNYLDELYTMLDNQSHRSPRCVNL